MLGFGPLGVIDAMLMLQKHMEKIQFCIQKHAMEFKRIYFIHVR